MVYMGHSKSCPACRTSKLLEHVSTTIVKPTFSWFPTSLASHERGDFGPCNCTKWRRWLGSGLTIRTEGAENLQSLKRCSSFACVSSARLYFTIPFQPLACKQTTSLLQPIAKKTKMNRTKQTVPFALAHCGPCGCGLLQRSTVACGLAHPSWASWWMAWK